MKEQIVEKITKIKEYYSTLPKNNLKNRKIFINEVSETKDNIIEKKNNIYNELIKRTKKFDKLTINPNIEKIKQEISVYEEIFELTNEINTPYQKLNFDEIIYDISKYYKGDLTKVNENIKKIIDIFKNVGVSLTADDFSYSYYVNDYMKTFFAKINESNSLDITQKFENIYWKSPNIINHIELNIRYLYYKYEKKIIKYVTDRANHLLTKHNCKLKDLVNKYYELKIEYNDLMRKDEYLVFNKFKNKQIMVASYSDDVVDRIKDKYISDKEYDGNIANFIKINQTVYEYKNYLKFSYIFDYVKNIYNEKDKYKNVTKSKLKEIVKLESKLIKLNKQFLKAKEEVKREAINLDINTILTQINDLYTEFDELNFGEKVLTTLNDNSSIFSLYRTIFSYHYNLVKCIKEHDPEMGEATVKLVIEEFKELLSSPYNTLINNLNITLEHNFPIIISNRYNLMNLSIPTESLTSENLDTIIAETKTVVFAYIYNNMNIKLKDIEMFCKIQDLSN